MNEVRLIGRLGRDPETRYAQSGSAVANFSVATSEKWRDKASGEMKEETEWHNVVAFGRQAEVAGEFLRKGSLLAVSGRLKTDKYEKDGITRYSTKIVLQRMEMLGGKSDYDQQPQNAGPQAQPVSDEDFDDDIPF